MVFHNSEKHINCVKLKTAKAIHSNCAMWGQCLKTNVLKIWVLLSLSGLTFQITRGPMAYILEITTVQNENRNRWLINLSQRFAFYMSWLRCILSYLGLCWNQLFLLELKVLTWALLELKMSAEYDVGLEKRTSRGSQFSEPD